MPDIIRLLPDHIANQIAAGEVIQRPASVVKELLENAIDAEATKVKVIIKDSGKSLIQVIDNGKGMTSTDARLSLERHATSKIEKAEDLFAIKTKGFRGEALASIASVAQLEMKTRQADDELGTRILVTASKIDIQEPVASLVGTDVAIKKLFFNIPARRKFLKSDVAEFRQILMEFNRIALAHPDIHLELHHNEKLIVQLPAEGHLKRIIGVLGKGLQDKLIKIEEDTEIVQVRGFIGTAESAKSQRGDQYLFINNRFFKSPYFNHAITSAYSNLIQDGKFPIYVMYLTVDPAQIDVNVHPTKQEIKFEDDRSIYNYLKVSVRHGLAKHHMIPIMDFEQPTPAFLRGSPNLSSAPGSSSSKGGYISPIDPVHRPIGWEAVFEGVKERSPNEQQPQMSSLMGGEMGMKEVPPSSKTFQGYIVRSTPEGLMLIDQRAAHIRVLYEDFLQRMSIDKAPSQGMLFPKTIELTATEASIMDAIIDDINNMGFDIAPFGQRTYVLHGVPAFHEMIEMHEGTIKNILHELGNETYSGTEIAEKLAEASARSAAISFDKKLSDVETKHLVEQLFACELPDRTPSGQLCYVILPREEIDKKFKKR
jgi:DNA mismatch repair protein MutL